jgi:hypothetical protein
MEREIVGENAGKFYDEVKERIAGLDQKEKQQFLEGIIYALSAIYRLARPDVLTPLEIEQFKMSAISNVYSMTLHIGLDSEKYMKDEVEKSRTAEAVSHVFSAMLHVFFGLPVDRGYTLTVDNLVSMAKSTFSEEDRTTFVKISEGKLREVYFKE